MVHVWWNLSSEKKAVVDVSSLHLYVKEIWTFSFLSATFFKLKIYDIVKSYVHNNLLLLSKQWCCSVFFTDFPLTDGIQNGSYYSSEWMDSLIHTWVHWISQLDSGSFIYSTGIFYQLEDAYGSGNVYDIESKASNFFLFVHETGSASQKKTWRKEIVW